MQIRVLKPGQINLEIMTPVSCNNKHKRRIGTQMPSKNQK